MNPGYFTNNTFTQALRSYLFITNLPTIPTYISIRETNSILFSQLSYSKDLYGKKVEENNDHGKKNSVTRTENRTQAHIGQVRNVVNAFDIPAPHNYTGGE